MKLNQLDTLRKQGYKIKIEHFRYVVGGGPARLMLRRAIDRHNHGSFAAIPYKILPCGGRVVCEIVAPNGDKAQGISNCSVQDNFKRKIGTAMAFGRAMKLFDEARD